MTDKGGRRPAASGRQAPAAETGPEWGPTVTRPDLLVAGSDRDFRRLVYALLTISIRFDRLRERLGRLMGLSGLQYHILMIIAELGAERPVSVGMVAEALHVSGAYVTMETGKLARRGLVVKRTNPDDRRGVLLSLTGRGTQAVARLAPCLREINDALFARLGREEFRAFCAIAEGMLTGTADALAVAERLLAAAPDGGNGAAGVD